jgi:hypothetical protein
LARPSRLRMTGWPFPANIAISRYRERYGLD